MTLKIIEIIGSLSLFISIYYASRSNLLTWPLSIIAQIAFFILFYVKGLYANMALQIYFTILSLFGWYNWKKLTENTVKTLSVNWQIVLILICVSGIVFTYFLYTRIFNIVSYASFFDVSSTVLSVIAVFLLSKKYLQCWYIWIIVDLIYIGLNFSKGLYLMMVLYLVVCGISVKALSNWRRSSIREL